MRFLQISSLVFLIACGAKTTPVVDTTGNVCPDGTKIAATSEDIDFRICAIRTQESAAGNLMADAVWWALNDDHFSTAVTAQAAGVRFYVDNSGAGQLKVVVPKGELCSGGYNALVTGKEQDGLSFAQATLPYFNWVVLVTMPQTKLGQFFERAFAINGATQYPNKDGSFLIISKNVKITVDMSDYEGKAQTVSGKPNVTSRQGSLIKSIEIDGVAVDLTSTANITFAASSFVAGMSTDDKGGIMGAPFEGGGVSGGYISDYVGNRTSPMTNSFVVVDAGKQQNDPGTLTHTSALDAYVKANSPLTPKVDGRFVYENANVNLDTCDAM